MISRGIVIAHLLSFGDVFLNLKKTFSKIVQYYESVNRLFTLGLDSFWRRNAADSIPRSGVLDILDICCGTGDMLQELKSRFSGRIIGIDFSKPMLDKARTLLKTENLGLTLAEAKHLPFPDETFDVLSISFATRNLNQSLDTLQTAIKEFHRVLRRGGLFLNLETTIPQRRPFKYLLEVYTEIIVKTLGRIFTRSKDEYGFLAESIMSFYTRKRFAQIIGQSGFVQVQWKTLPPGVSVIHWAWKK
ncbi:MAG: ubiquinone/menaquinone biosynthesis methyltransferase [Candidatus Lokiarchaeota archaeon]|nr:ubiquinone/menaquinone biosynthesis methyltransferase [Candidatus Lokiarchaeota archaeon]